MALIRYAVVLALVFYTLFQTSASFECYECYNEQCSENFTVMSHNPCLDIRKCFRMSHPETGAVLIRGCAKEGYCGANEECEMCEGELCNSSSRVFSFFSLLGVLGIILANVYVA